jgi:hypothetical protein
MSKEEIIILNKLGYLFSMDLYRDVDKEIQYWLQELANLTTKQQP